MRAIKPQARQVACRLPAGSLLQDVAQPYAERPDTAGASVDLGAFRSRCIASWQVTHGRLHDGVVNDNQKNTIRTYQRVRREDPSAALLMRTPRYEFVDAAKPSSSCGRG